MAISAAILANTFPERGSNGRVKELVTITGATGAVGDTVTYKPVHSTRGFLVEDGSVSGVTNADGRRIDFTANVALANRSITIEVEGLV